jgi:hypothetical protein
MNLLIVFSFLEELNATDFDTIFYAKRLFKTFVLVTYTDQGLDFWPKPTGGIATCPSGINQIFNP